MWRKRTGCLFPMFGVHFRCFLACERSHRVHPPSLGSPHGRLSICAFFPSALSLGRLLQEEDRVLRGARCGSVFGVFILKSCTSSTRLVQVTLLET